MSANSETTMVGLAFACGVLATVGVLSATSGSNADQFLASATVTAARPTVATAASMPYARSTYEAYAPSYDVAAFEGVEADADADWELEEPIYEAPAPAAQSQWGLLSVGLAVSAFFGALAPYLWKRSTSAETQALSPMDEQAWAMAAYNGKTTEHRAAMLTAPRNQKAKFMNSRLAKEAREKYGVRSLPVRTEDEVRVLSGDFAGTTGKVKAVDYGKLVVHVEGVDIKKNDQSTKPVNLPAHRVEIVEPKMDDSRRAKIARSGK